MDDTNLCPFAVVWVKAHFNFSALPCADGNVFCGKVSDVLPPPVDSNAGSPSPLAATPRNPRRAAFVRGVDFLVLAVFRSCDRSKVHKPIVASDAVDVVNVGFWPSPESQRPDYSMRLHGNAHDCANFVSVRVDASKCGFACILAVPSVGMCARLEKVCASQPPSQSARVRVVIKKIAQGFRRYYRRFSHSIGPYRVVRRGGALQRAVAPTLPRKPHSINILDLNWAAA